MSPADIESEFWQCCVCGDRFDSEEEVERHYEETHLAEDLKDARALVEMN